MAIEGGRDIAPLINSLLSLPFPLKIATQDFHPPGHISFATSHDPPNNEAFKSYVRTFNPYNGSQKIRIPVWPEHCLQGTQGVEIIPEIDASRFDYIVQKGKDKRVEMWSAFADLFGNKTTLAANLDLAKLLKDAAITHLFVVGLAGDHCVGCTALGGKNEGFRVFVIEDAVKSVDTGPNGWVATKAAFARAGVGLIHMDSAELDPVKTFSVPP